MRLAIFLLSGCYCAAQSVSFGVVGGGRSTDDINFAAVSESKRYIIGPMIDIGMPFGFGIEFDALYSREGFRAGNSTPLATTNINSHSNVWQLPIVVKQSLPFPVVKPFVEVGYAPRFMNGSIDTSGSFLATPTQRQSFNMHDSTDWAASHGVVFGGGVRLHAGRLRLMPEVRYTHWNNMPILIHFPDGPTVESAQDQVDVLIGVGWKIAGR